MRDQIEGGYASLTFCIAPSKIDDCRHLSVDIVMYKKFVEGFELI